MGAMSPTHWLIVLGVLVLLFGAKKLPDMARSIGQSARVFKGEMKDLTDNTTDETTHTATTTTAPAGDATGPKAVEPVTPAGTTPATGTTPGTRPDPAVERASGPTL